VQVPDLAGRNASHDPAFPFTHWEISFLFDAKLISDLVSSTDRPEEESIFQDVPSIYHPGNTCAAARNNCADAFMMTARSSLAVSSDSHLRRHGRDDCSI
jgi:hypothetical protein